MKIVLFVEGGRQAPAMLFEQCAEWGVDLRRISLANTDWQDQLQDAFGIMLMLPVWGGFACLHVQRRVNWRDRSGAFVEAPPSLR